MDTKDTKARTVGSFSYSLFLCVLSVLCVQSSVMRAQQGGFAMPDAKQMSGIPRPVDDLPKGSISIRLVRGSLSNNIPNHPIELHVGSKVLTQKTDENGRAQFDGLAAGATVKAVAVVNTIATTQKPTPLRLDRGDWMASGRCIV